MENIEEAVGHSDRQRQKKGGHDFVGPAVALVDKPKDDGLDHGVNGSCQVDKTEELNPRIHYD
jgi:hypothetical protein